MTQGTAGKSDKTYFVKYWVDLLIHELTLPEKRRLDGWFEDILQDNHALGGHKKGFIYGSEFLHLSDVSVTGHEKLLFKPVHPTLRQETQGWKVGQARLDNDTQIMNQGFSALLFTIPVENNADVRNILPDHLMKNNAMRYLLESHERTRPPAYSYENNPIRMYEYEQLMDLADLYISARML